MPRIAIIGAGMAGLSAAKKLTQMGHKDFIVLEGSDRIGGRIHPIPYHGGYLQMGAQFVNGSANPIYEIAKEIGVLDEAISDTEHIDAAQFIYGNQPIDEKDIQLFRKFIAPLDRRYRDFAENYEIMGRAYTFYSLYMEDYQRFLEENNITGQRKLVFDALSRSYRSYWEFEWSADWTDLSLHVLKAWKDGGPECESFTTNKIGYRAILDHIKSKIPEHVFHFNTFVEQIDYSQPTIRIITRDSRVFEADHVIVTSSLGHLKRFYTKLFNPLLPKYKQEAIEKIGFGGSCKIFFRWEKPFWSPKTFSIAPLPVEGMARRAIEPFEMEMTTLQTVPWEPNTLMAWIAGAGHKVLDDMEDDEIILKMTKLIRDMMNDQSIPPPSEMVRTRLTHNELLCGGYSYLSYAQAQAGISTEWLARPIKIHNVPRLCFAGEATHDKLFQTCIGAYLSAEREVHRIMSLYLPVQSRI